MKKIITITLLFAATITNAQNPFYKKLVETHTDDATIVTVPTPAMLGWGYYMQFSLHKIFLANNTVQYVLQAGNPAHEELTGNVTINIVFRDQEVITFDNAHYQPEYIETVYAHQCEFIPTVVLPGWVVQKLKTKKISYFRVDGERAYNLTATSFASRIKRFTKRLTAVEQLPNAETAQINQ